MYLIATPKFTFLQVCRILDEFQPFIINRFVCNREKATILKHGEEIGRIVEI